MYQALSGEFAMLYQQYEQAAVYYLQAAQTTHDARLAEQAARIALLGRFDAVALEASQLWLELAPDALPAREALVAALIRRQDVAAVQPHLEQLFASRRADSRDADNHLVSIMIGHPQDLVPALQAIGRYADEHPDSFVAWHLYGQLALHADQLERAASVATHLLQLQPRAIETTRLYVRVLRRQGRRQEALEYLGREIGKRPKVAELYMTRARLALEMMRVEDARVDFVKALSLSPDDPDVLFALTLLSLQARQPDAAGQYLLRLQALHWEPDQLQFYLGQMEEMRGNNAAALDRYREVDGSEHYLEAQIRVVWLLAGQGDIDGARERLHILQLQFQEQRKELLHVEGEILYEMARYEEALAVFDQALTEYQGDRELLFIRALSAEKLGRMTDVERDLRQILANDPGNVGALNALGFVLADKTDRYQEAYELIKQALELNPNDNAILDSMGWVSYRRGDLQAAEQYLRRAWQASRDNEIAAHLGEVLWVLGEHEQALEIWNQALSTKPDDGHLRETMKRFGQ